MSVGRSHARFLGRREIRVSADNENAPRLHPASGRFLAPWSRLPTGMIAALVVDLD